MDYNYHTHTERCGHAAKGSDEEYIKAAIAGGIKFMGFSDHAPFMFPNGTESGYRVPCSKAEDYFETLKALREKYKSEIDIKIGFEMEYYPAYFEEMLEYMRKIGAEYLILGQHYAGDEIPDGQHSAKGTENPEHLKKYVDCLVRAIESRVFSYIAHPDIINFYGDDELYKKEMTKICQAAIEYQTPLEINFLGIRDKRRYPNEKFWEIVGETGAPVTFGFDAHCPADAADKKSFKVAMDMVERYKLNYIGMPKIIKLN